MSLLEEIEEPEEVENEFECMYSELKTVLLELAGEFEPDDQDQASVKELLLSHLDKKISRLQKMLILLVPPASSRMKSYAARISLPLSRSATG